MKINSGHISAICYATFIGLSYMFTKIGLNHVSMDLLLAHRFTFGFVIFAFIAFFTKMERLTPKDYMKLLPLGIISPIFTFYLQSFGLKYIGSSEAGVIMALMPVMTIVFATIMLKERPKIIQIIGTLISVLGVITIFLFKGTNFSEGNMIGIISVSLSVLGFVMIGILVKRLITTYTFIQISFVLLFVGTIAFNSNYFLGGGSISAYLNTTHSSAYFYSLFYLGSFSTAFSVLASNYALSKLTASQFSIFGNLTPVISVLAGTFILKEPFGIIQVIGTLMVIIGVIAANYQKKSKAVNKLQNAT